MFSAIELLTNQLTIHSVRCSWLGYYCNTSSLYYVVLRVGLPTIHTSSQTYNIINICDIWSVTRSLRCHGCFSLVRNLYLISVFMTGVNGLLLVWVLLRLTECVS